MLRISRKPGERLYLFDDRGYVGEIRCMSKCTLIISIPGLTVKREEILTEEEALQVHKK